MLACFGIAVCNRGFMKLNRILYNIYIGMDTMRPMQDLMQVWNLSNYLDVSALTQLCAAYVITHVITANYETRKQREQQLVAMYETNWLPWDLLDLALPWLKTTHTHTMAKP